LGQSREVAVRHASVSFGRVPDLASKSIAAPAATEVGPQSATRAGLLYALSAYTVWGFIPVYFRVLAPVPPRTILCHRIVWSAVFMVVLIGFRQEWRPIRQALESRRNLLYLALGAVLVASNWLVFIYAVSTRQLLQASLGYFINPLLSIALGMLFLKEQLRRWQWLAVVIAVLAVANMAVQGSGFPWIALSLAGSFGFYGLVRKTLNISSLHALLVESVILCPLALAAFVVLPNAHISLGKLGLLSLSGVITAVPLLFFGAALRRLRLSTMGFLQYVNPSLQFLVAIAFFREPLDRTKLGSFLLCWLAIAVYVTDSALRHYAPPVVEEPN
jgi:chloramphenicol-sensitive protein RarD